MELQLAGSTAVVAGAARGIGLAIAEAFAAEKANVVLIDREAEVNRAAQQLAGTGRRAEADDQLRPALGFYRSVSATRFIRDAEALLAASA